MLREQKYATAIVCGGRHFNDMQMMDLVLSSAVQQLGLATVIQGEARGADKLAKYWAEDNHLAVISVPAQWDTHGKKAGYLRNVEMADLNPDFILAFPGGRGTKMMIDIANKRGIKVYEVEKLLE